jgi:hypothetical protein
VTKKNLPDVRRSIRNHVRVTIFQKTLDQSNALDGEVKIWVKGNEPGGSLSHLDTKALCC